MGRCQKADAKCAHSVTRAVAGALVSGDLEEDLASVDGNEDCIRRVLQQASAENAEVSWLLLRCLLDAQVLALQFFSFAMHPWHYILPAILP
jgi:hypothetical protein